MYRVIIKRSGQVNRYVFREDDPDSTLILGPFETYTEAVGETRARYEAFAHPKGAFAVPSEIEGTPDNFTARHKGEIYDYTTRVYIEEIPNEEQRPGGGYAPGREKRQKP